MELLQSARQEANDFFFNVRNALTDELLVPYIRYCIKIDGTNDPTPEGFFKFVMMSKDPNYTFIADIVL